MFDLGPLATRAALYTLGQALGWDWTTEHSADRSWFEWLDTLDDAELAATMGGMSTALAEGVSGGLDLQDPWQVSPDVERLAAQLSPEVGTALARAEIRRRPLRTAGEDAVLASLEVTQSESSTEFARRQAAGALGRLAWDRCYLKESSPTCLTTFLGRVAPSLQSEVAWIFGEELGRSQGYLASADGPWKAALSPEPAEALAKAFYFQSSWTFLR